MLHPPSGCAFHPRCPYVLDEVQDEMPPLEPAVHGGRKACWVEVDAGRSYARRRSNERHRNFLRGLTSSRSPARGKPLLEVRDLKVHFPFRRRAVRRSRA